MLPLRANHSRLSAVNISNVTTDPNAKILPQRVRLVAAATSPSAPAMIRNMLANRQLVAIPLAGKIIPIASNGYAAEAPKPEKKPCNPFRGNNPEKRKTPRSAALAKTAAAKRKLFVKFKLLTMASVTSNNTPSEIARLFIYCIRLCAIFDVRKIFWGR